MLFIKLVRLIVNLFVSIIASSKHPLFYKFPIILQIVRISKKRHIRILFFLCCVVFKPSATETVHRHNKLIPYQRTLVVTIYEGFKVFPYIKDIFIIGFCNEALFEIRF